MQWLTTTKLFISHRSPLDFEGKCFETTHTHEIRGDYVHGVEKTTSKI